MKQKGLITVNRFGVSITQCCASCAFKELTDVVSERTCTKRSKTVSPHTVCCHWQMSANLKMAGLGNGKIKCKEYLKYLKSEREDERLARQLGLKITPKPIAEIKAAFEAKYVSIYEKL